MTKPPRPRRGRTPTDVPPYVDVDGFAELARLSPATVRHYRSRGNLPDPDVVLGRTPGWRPSTVAAWVTGTAAPPDPGPVFLDSVAAAAIAGIQTMTWRHYMAEGRTPEPDLWLGRSAGWSPETIRAWTAARPGKGGRPRSGRGHAGPGESGDHDRS